jgi:hypothetical protein
MAARRASLIHSRSQLLGVVYAPDEKSAQSGGRRVQDRRRTAAARLIVRPNDD